MNPIQSRLVCAGFCLTSILLITSCTAPQYNYRPEATRISTPPLNTIATVNVGDEMLKQGRFYQRDAIHLDRPIKFGLLGYYTMSPGYYAKTGENHDSEFYAPAQGQEAGSIVKSVFSDPWEAIQLFKTADRICIVTVFHAHVCENATGVRRTKYLSLADDSFQQTLIYSGKVGSKIKIGYREFSNSVARPAFNNDVEYDLDASNVIGYKGARIEVLEATNQIIRYRVLQNFNQAEY